MVGDDEVPTAPVERGLHVLRGVYPLPGGIVPSLAQRPQKEQGVILGVLDQQDPEIHTHYSGTSPDARAWRTASIAISTLPLQPLPHVRLCNSPHIAPLISCRAPPPRSFVQLPAHRAPILLPQGHASNSKPARKMNENHSFGGYMSATRGI